MILKNFCLIVSTLGTATSASGSEQLDVPSQNKTCESFLAVTTRPYKKLSIKSPDLFKADTAAASGNVVCDLAYSVVVVGSTPPKHIDCANGGIAPVFRAVEGLPNHIEGKARCSFSTELTSSSPTTNVNAEPADAVRIIISPLP
jgi:hypothetical protein